MKLVFDTGVQTYRSSEDEYQEQLRIFKFEDTDAEDFEMFSHNEKISELGIERETPTPDKDHGKVVRHNIDSDSMTDLVIVTTNTIIW